MHSGGTTWIAGASVRGQGARKQRWDRAISNIVPKPQLSAEIATTTFITLSLVSNAVSPLPLISAGNQHIYIQGFGSILKQIRTGVQRLSPELLQAR